MSRPLVPCNGNDKVYTPDYLAVSIVKHFKPHGRCLEPCAGKGAFIHAIENNANVACIDWCEIDEDRDFRDMDIPSQRYDFVVTNCPWSQLRPFLKKSMAISNNVVFLCLVNAFFMKARQRDMQEAGFGMKEILFVPTPPKPWPQTGFSLGAVHIQRGWTGDCKMTQLETL